jgi:hypothetical protein
MKEGAGLTQGRAFQAKVTANAKALWLDPGIPLQGTGRRATMDLAVKLHKVSKRQGQLNRTGSRP